MQDEPYAFHPLTPDRWSDLVDLFGPQRGATSGCWCMWPRMRSSEFRAMPREARRDAFHALVDAGPPPGILAYEGEVAVGWCAVSPRDAVRRFEITATSRRPDGDEARTGLFAITCFYVRSSHRRAGLMPLLAGAAVDFARRHGATAVDACPIEPDRPLHWGDGFVGITPVFARLGFREVARRSPRRPLMRLDLIAGA